MALKDLSWREGLTDSYYWEPFNRGYGTWYRLVCDHKGMRRPVTMDSGKQAEVEVYPDMEKGRWYWSVKVGLTKKTAETPEWGTCATAEEALAAATHAFRNYVPKPETVKEQLQWQK